MVHKNGTRYPEEFKQQIVDFYNAGTSVTKLTNEYGLVEQTIINGLNFILLSFNKVTVQPFL